MHSTALKTENTEGTSTDGIPSKVVRLNKRSNSSDVTTVSDSSSPSDTWKFFTEIKGKIAKSVEEKITEIKARNQDDGSPSKGKLEEKNEKYTKDSNLSDSEELSESSLSKTCGIVSTTEGVEMSSDEESPSLKNEVPINQKLTEKASCLLKSRQKCRLLKPSKKGYTTSREGAISLSSLAKMHNVNVDDVKDALPECNDIESGVEVLEDEELGEYAEHEKDTKKNSAKIVSSKSMILNALEKSIDNIEIDKDGTLNIKEVAGLRWRGNKDEDFVSDIKTVFQPKGFFDYRNCFPKKKTDKYLFPVLVLVIAVLYLLIQKYSSYVAGMIAGIVVTVVAYYVYGLFPLETSGKKENILVDRTRYSSSEIREIPAVKEYQSLLKYEGWVNEYPDPYDPSTYHINLTQPVYLKLEENWLRISNTTSKVPKRAMWNEEEIKKIFKHRRIYNLLGAKVSLLPVGLAKIRQWSKKYPICISISKDHFLFDEDSASRDTDDEKESSPDVAKKGASISSTKKNSTISSSQRYSKLFAEQDNFFVDGESRSDSSSPAQEEEKPVDNNSEKTHELDKEIDIILDDSWSNCTLDESPTETNIFIFGRTDREKEDWFRRLTNATHSQTSVACKYGSLIKTVSMESILKESEYNIFMSSILKAFKRREEWYDKSSNDAIEIANVSWINAFLGRILFDCLCDEVFTCKIKDRIQRKLASIRLPYFIEELSVTEINLGKSSPLFKKIGLPTLDDRGLWIDMAMSYEGLVVLTLMTKLNLMRLKQPPTGEKQVQNKSAIFHSDVDDSAESSSDDESVTIPYIPESTGVTASSAVVVPMNKSKKLMKMVDRITESKFFQAATENKFIKRAMEGVSNTDLRLKVEVRAVKGTLVLNIPPPPNDRVWIGFRPVPEVSLSAHPIVGERNISFMHVTNWIEKKLLQEFQKLLVIPNMEDLVIPILISKLPD